MLPGESAGGSPRLRGSTGVCLWDRQIIAKRDGKGVTKGVALGVVLRLQYPFP